MFIGWACSEQHFARSNNLREETTFDKDDADASSN